MSRHEAIRTFKSGEVKSKLASMGITAKSATAQGLAEEAPEAYKNVTDVIASVDEPGIAKKIVRLDPVGVLKG